MIELKNITQKYGEVTLFENFNLTIKEKSFTAIVGASGSGKSHIIRYLSHLQVPTSGEVITLNIIPVIFQERSILHFLTVLENVALPLIIQGVKKKEAQEKAFEMLKVVGLEAHANKYSTSISGGQNQRAAIARSLVVSPEVLLLDEFSSSLDYKTKRGLQDFLKELHEKSKATFILISHDLMEVSYLCDDVYVLKDGQIKNHIEVPDLKRDDPKLFEITTYIENLI